MKSILIVLALAFVAFALNGVHHQTLTVPQPVVTQDLVDFINNGNFGWQADMNQGSRVDGITKEEARTLCGVLKGGPVLAKKEIVPLAHIAALPASWSAITQWPNCPSIGTIRDQSACGSCWAFGAVEAMSDRSCIFLKQNISLSSGNMAFCCTNCGAGCNGGYPTAAWEYYQNAGLVEEACYPYPLPSCDHHIPGSKNPCPSQEYKTPACPNKCTNSSWTGPAWKTAKHTAKNAYSVDTSQDQIMAELYKNGPVEAAFDVYEDFLTYKSGVYSHQSGDFLGGHAIKILGWGSANGVSYWIAANSWNPNWGNKGFFWIKRGTDECGIEDMIVAGIPHN